MLLIYISFNLYWLLIYGLSIKERFLEMIYDYIILYYQDSVIYYIYTYQNQNSEIWNY